MAKAQQHTYTAKDDTGKIWYANRPQGNLHGEMPLGAAPVSWGEQDDPWNGAKYQTGSGRIITVTRDERTKESRWAGPCPECHHYGKDCHCHRRKIGRLV